MSGVAIGALMGVFVLVLLVLRVHIAAAMLLAGGIGYALVGGFFSSSPSLCSSRSS